MTKSKICYIVIIKLKLFAKIRKYENNKASMNPPIIKLVTMCFAIPKVVIWPLTDQSCMVHSVDSVCMSEYQTTASQSEIKKLKNAQCMNESLNL